MAKAKSTKVEVNCSLNDLYDGFAPYTLISQTPKLWIYEGTSDTEMVMVEGKGLNKTGDSFTSGRITSIHIMSDDVSLMEIDYGRNSLQAKSLGSPPNIFDLILNALRGKDRIIGGDGDDYLTGGDGRDVINGGKGDDSIVSGGGNDKINVSEGNDYIGLAKGDGSDTVLNFDAEGGMGAQDLISAFFDSCNVLADGDNTIIERKSGGDTLHLIGVKSRDITESDFAF
jgi:hypothetical protein